MRALSDLCRTSLPGALASGRRHVPTEGYFVARPWSRCQRMEVEAVGHTTTGSTVEGPSGREPVPQTGIIYRNNAAGNYHSPTPRSLEHGNAMLVGSEALREHRVSRQPSWFITTAQYAILTASRIRALTVVRLAGLTLVLRKELLAWDGYRIHTPFLLLCCAIYPYRRYCVGGPSCSCGFVPLTCLRTVSNFLGHHAADVCLNNSILSGRFVTHPEADLSRDQSFTFSNSSSDITTRPPSESVMFPQRRLPVSF